MKGLTLIALVTLVHPFNNFCTHLSESGRVGLCFLLESINVHRCTHFYSVCVELLVTLCSQHFREKLLDICEQSEGESQMKS